MRRRLDLLKPVRHLAAKLNDVLNPEGQKPDFLSSITSSQPVAQPQAVMPAKTEQRKLPDTRLYGASGTPIISGFVSDLQEHVPELRGREGIQIYEQMRRSDADVAAMLSAVTLPIRAAQYDVLPGVEDNEPEYELAKEIAEAVKENLFGGLESEDQFGNKTTQRFESVIENALLCVPCGVSASEDQWIIDGSEVRLRKISPRLPSTFYQFPVMEDGETLRALVQWGYRGASWVTAAVPSSKISLFSLRKEGANFYGRSMLREAYQHWWIKQALYRIDSIACERNGIGIPSIKTDAEASSEDKAFARDWVSNVSANEVSGIAGPMELKLVGVTGTPKDVLASIQHQSEMICKSGLAMFMSLGTSQTGSRALGSTMTDFFLLSEEALSRFINDTISDTSIRRYVDFNFPRAAGKRLPYPRLSSGNIVVLNPLDIAEAVKELGDSKIDIFQPDDELENWFRKRFGMPLKSTTTRPRFAPTSVHITDQTSGDPEDLVNDRTDVNGGTKPGTMPVKPAITAKKEKPAGQSKFPADKKPNVAVMREALHDRLKWHGLDVSIENAAGTTRTGKSPEGKAWSTTMVHPYGYIRMTKGADGDHVDCYVGPDESAADVFVVHQNDPVSGAYDEDKCMLNFGSADAARAAYIAQHSEGEKAFGSMETIPVDTFIEKVLATRNNPGAVNLSELLTRPLHPHELKHDFAGHVARQDKTQTAIRRILAGAVPGLVREAAKRAAKGAPQNLTDMSLPVDHSLANRLAKSINIAHSYGLDQVYAERKRATKRGTSRKPKSATMSSTESHKQDKPGLIAHTAVGDLYNGITSRVKAAHIDAYKQGERGSDLEDYIITALEEMSDGYLDRIAMEAARSGVAGGRYAGFEDLGDEIKSYARSEAMDQNTCGPCEEGDGVEWQSLDEVDWSPGDDCEGGDACRGQLIPTFEDEGTVELGGEKGE